MVYSVNLVDVQVDAFETSEDSRVVLDSVTFCWRVHYAKHLEVVEQKLLPRVTTHQHMRTTS